MNEFSNDLYPCCNTNCITIIAKTYDKNNLRIIDTCSLGNRQFIVVTQYETEKHLLAVSTSGISHLAKLSTRDSGQEDSPTPG